MKTKAAKGERDNVVDNVQWKCQYERSEVYCMFLRKERGKEKSIDMREL